MESALGAGDRRLAARQAAHALARALDERAERTAHLVAAIGAGDRAAATRLAGELAGAIEAVAAQRSALQAVQAHLEPGEALAALRAATGRAGAAEGLLREALAAAGATSLAAWLAPADPLLAGPWDRETDLVVLAGAGAGPRLEALLSAGQKRVFVLGDAAVSGPPPADAVVHAAPALDSLESACWHVPWPQPEQVRVAALPGCDPGTAEAAGRRLQETIRAVADFHRAAEVSGPGLVRDATRNLARIASVPSAHHLDGILAGVPAVIVSAGPSLDKNVGLLRRLQGRAVIVGINQTVRALRLAGVRPDVILACDAQNLAYQFEGVAPGELPALGLAASVSPALFDIPADEVFTYAGSPVAESWIYDLAGEDAALRSAGTVAGAALQLALKLGCSPILFVGQDLALDGRKYYADGAADGGQSLDVLEDGRLSLRSVTSKLRLGDPDEYRARLERYDMSLFEVPGWGGGTVLTTRSMKAQLVSLRSHVHDAAGKAAFWNCTEGGARLDGMEHLPLAEAIARLPERPVDAAGALRAAFAAVDRAGRRARCAARLAALGRDVDAVAALARRCAWLLGEGKEAKLATARAELQERSRALPLLAVLTLVETRAALGSAGTGATAAELAAAESNLYRAIAGHAAAIALAVQSAVKELES